MAKERHLGIELLRVLSMGMIVLHHLLTWGGLLFAFPKLSATDTALRLLNAFANCAVNVYALITGYVGSRLRPRGCCGNGCRWCSPVLRPRWRQACLPRLTAAFS